MLQSLGNAMINQTPFQLASNAARRALEEADAAELALREAMQNFNLAEAAAEAAEKNLLQVIETVGVR
jgi:hypothetical protein